MNPPRPELDLVPLFRTLRDHQVDFIVVGGTAAWAHGASRRPDDLDIVTRCDSADQFQRLAAALRDLRAAPHFEGLTPDQARNLSYDITPELLEAIPITTWSTSAGGLDVFDAVSGPGRSELEYDDLAARAVSRRFAGITVQVASVADVIASKTVAGRDKDRQAVAELTGQRASTLEPPSHHQQPTTGRDHGYER